MNKELSLRTLAYLVGYFKTHNGTMINLEEIEAINFILDENEKLQQENKQLKERLDKATEYVKTHKPSDTISFPLMKKDEENQVKSCFDYEFREIYQKELLEILKGDE